MKPIDSQPGASSDPTEALGIAEWERTYSMFTHLSLLAAHFGLLIIPALVLWLIKRDQSVFIDDHGKEALNFHISLLIYAVAVTVLGFFTCGVGVVLYVPLYALGIVGMILGAIAANKGRYFRYPATIRMF